ncbi:MAG: DNA-protecting protein DprA [Erysipelotrichaceae bacterium]|nr:DNA-protecting protein DprA [Erysipelotrichaceae bacterium]
MNSELLKTYSFYYQGEYSKIRQAIIDRKQMKPFDVSNAVTIFDEEYPKCFFDLKYPPFVFYYKGDLSLLKRKCIAVVGSRQPCDYALKATKALSEHYQDTVIVSGLAKGIDAFAHQYAKDTIGILGCGIDYIYPACNRDLIKDVEKRGLIISEYPAYAKPYAYHFPFRNRLIAALSDRVYIMESKARSGTMTTVNEALELGKEVRVLPYDIFMAEGVHNNQLIYEGATPVTHEEIAF